MKPIRLRFQAIGPYADTVEIDFTRLWKHGVFTITGPNGAGKTTIFDAMAYALYGEIPGYREVNDIRSQFAGASKETFVEFVFEVDGVRWLISRTPTQLRPMVRGTGMTEKPATVLLRRESDSSGGITRITSAKAEVERLVGLNELQFQQVILIPQGKFEDVLKADTAKRLEILRQLFPVEIFSKFTDEVLKLKWSEARDIHVESKSRASGSRDLLVRDFGDVARRLSGLDGDEAFVSSRDSAVDAAAELKTETLTGAEVQSAFEAVEIARQLLSAQSDELAAVALSLAQQVENADEAAKELQHHLARVKDSKSFPDQEKEDAERKASADLADKANGFKPVIEAQLAAEMAAAKAARDVDKAVATGKKLAPAGIEWPTEPDIGVLRTFHTAMARHRDDGDAAAAQAEELIELQSELDDAREQFAQAQAGEKEWNDFLASVKIEDAALVVERRAISGSAAKLEKVRAALDKLDDELKHIADAEALEKQRVAAEAKLAEASKKAKAASAALEKAQESLALDSAAHAATLLKEGSPCPTCGACEHPKPAKQRKSAGEVDIEGLRLAHAESTKALAAANKAVDTMQGRQSASTARAADVVGAEVEKRTAEAEELQIGVDRLEELDERRETIKVDTAEANKTLQEFSGIVKASQAVLSREPAFKKALSAFIKKHGAIEEFVFDAGVWDEFIAAVSAAVQAVDFSNAQAAAAVSAARMAAPLVKQLGAADVQSALALVKPPRAVAEIRASLDSRAKLRLECNALIEQYRKSGRPTELPDTADLREQASVAKKRADEVRDAAAQVKQSLEHVQWGRKQFEKFELDVSRTRKLLEEIETLYKVCSGQGAVGAQRIKLETWVLAYYLRQVVAQANVQMNDLFNGRYQLSVAEEAETNVGQSGLELLVFDAETGKSRSVRGLSNGETFKAALALALALADVVAMGSRRSLDALFIDEGFGALDGPSREAVVDIFDRLQQTGRLVGLITHVESLQQALPTGIDVRPGDFDHGGGSSIKVHYPHD